MREFSPKIALRRIAMAGASLGLVLTVSSLMSDQSPSGESPEVIIDEFEPTCQMEDERIKKYAFLFDSQTRVQIVELKPDAFIESQTLEINTGDPKNQLCPDFDVSFTRSSVNNDLGVEVRTSQLSMVIGRDIFSQAGAMPPWRIGFLLDGSDVVLLSKNSISFTINPKYSAP